MWCIKYLRRSTRRYIALVLSVLLLTTWLFLISRNPKHNSNVMNESTILEIRRNRFHGRHSTSSLKTQKFSFNTDGLIVKRNGKLLTKNEISLDQSKELNIYGKYNLVIKSPGHGLGNKMFIYAAGKYLAKQHKRTFIYKPLGSDVFLKSFNLSYHSEEHHKHLNDSRYLKIHLAYCCRLFPQLFNLPDENIVLNGYFQSWKYWHPESVRKEFIFKDHIQKQAKAFLKGVRRNLPINTTLIGVHIRRGDILKPHLQQYGFTVAGKTYLDRAISYFQKKYPSHFIVTTNDLAWSMKNLRKHVHNISFSSKSNTAADDLCILSLCDHVIMTVGTFGWWAGFLSRGEVVYYKNWPKTGSIYERSVDKNGYFLPNWIGL